MSNKFLKKKGVIINHLASDLLQLKKGDRMPSITEYQSEYDVARGTVQNALNYLKTEGALVTKSHGHLGTFIEEIDYTILQEYALSEAILGTMTLPYSRLYEGLATGIYEEFKEHNIKLNLAYIRGSKERVRSISTKTYRFAVVSKFAAKRVIQQGEPLEIVIDFGKQTYLSGHVLLFANRHNNSIEDGMKVAIDYSSLDQQMLTNESIQNKQVELVEMPGHQIIHSLKSGQIDAGIWNFDEIRDKNYEELNYITLDNNQLEEEMSTSVIVCHQDDTSMEAFFNKSFDMKRVLDIQTQVGDGTMVPRY
ncbi:GntR family transcriptional regulator YhfZ [Vagococcus lutrae]|uniref:GntR family transcriptional regulator YhfZ n=1 Tax=Vagococcus lutrae TaxID=81947 RepID=UPI0019265B89|nr:GntR family transcriptional regulator YhfZ [Vagococcus lutrae]MDT2842133.1 GntR family transcriptional regulator YhfZ [Vagococcus lutrae]UQF11068.1 ABC transporter substrate-binding protein [Vagococcus lutrae]UQF63372.1 ABC transporter substrate-binding protein [Vagococcus lutrae]GEQ61395.1 GntR family transcriptional regulator [Vagococcus lutrae]GEQ63430.1 GntR family transcriptional regulator [Vagococcus lutrae]